MFDGGLLRILKKLPSPLHATIFPPEQKKHRWTCSVFGSGDDICVCFKKNVSIAAFIVGGQAFFFLHEEKCLWSWKAYVGKQYIEEEKRECS